MSNEQLGMSNEKSCVDCSHCKVAKESVVNPLTCFCDKTASKKHSEHYWRNKPPCKKFDDMSA
jgi:hypothetical protein